MNEIDIKLTGKTHSELLADALKAMEPMAALRAQIASNVLRAETAFAVLDAAFRVIHAGVAVGVRGQNDAGCEAMLVWMRNENKEWEFRIGAHRAHELDDDAPQTWASTDWWRQNNVGVFLFASTLCSVLVELMADEMEECAELMAENS